MGISSADIKLKQDELNNLLANFDQVGRTIPGLQESVSKAQQMLADATKKLEDSKHLVLTKIAEVTAMFQEVLNRNQLSEDAVVTKAETKTEVPVPAAGDSLPSLRQQA